jgi:hypothetical protein
MARNMDADAKWSEPDTATLPSGTTNGLPFAASQTASADSLRLPEDEVRVDQTHCLRRA